MARRTEGGLTMKVIALIALYVVLVLFIVRFIAVCTKDEREE
jgi:hypothetical protein